MRTRVERVFFKGSFREQKSAVWVLGGILLLALALRLCPLADLTRGSMACGEGRIMADASRPISQIMDQIPVDDGPLKYYLLHAVLYFGRSEFLLKLPALFFDITSILMLFCLGRLLFGRKAALLASFLMAVSMWHIHHVTMARNYPLYTFSVLASTLFLYRATQRTRIRDWLFFGMATALEYYSFYPGLFILAAQLCWLLICYGRRADLIKRLLLSLGIFFALSAPLIARLPQAFELKAYWGNGHWGLEGYQIWEALRDHFGGIAGSYPWGIFVFMISFVGVFHFQKKRREALLLLTLILVPICFYVFCIHALHINVLPRYFLHTYPFFLLMAAAGIVSWSHRAWKLAGIFVFMLPLCLYGFYQAGLIKRDHIPYDYLRHGENLATIASFIEQNQGSFDYVVMDPWMSIFCVQYYLDRDNKSPIVIAKDLKVRGRRYQVFANPKITIYGISGDLSFLKKLAATGRLLVIDSLGLIKTKLYSSSDVIFPWLQANAYRIEHDHFQEPPPAYEPEHPADFYFISPSPVDGGTDEAALKAARQGFPGKFEVKKRLVYPFNRKEWALREY